MAPAERAAAVADSGRDGRIICVTPNVCIDRTLVVPRLVPGAVLRAERTLAVAGGKGLNVARCLRVIGHRARTVGAIGGHTGDLVAALARDEGIDTRWTRISGETRTCVVIVSRETGTATGVYEPGPAVSADEWSAFARAVVHEAEQASAVCLCGSLPPGVPSERYRSLVASLRAGAARVFVDTHGDALAAAAGALPTAVKVNAEEAGGLLGREVATTEDAFAAAAVLRGAGVGQVVITLGRAGAVLAHAGGVVHAKPPDIKVVSAVGSGDAFLAGFVAAQVEGADPVAALRHGVAVGAANARTSFGGTFERTGYLALLDGVSVAGADDSA
jgi:1-phosphofructokinase family hexose kinase